MKWNELKYKLELFRMKKAEIKANNLTQAQNERYQMASYIHYLINTLDIIEKIEPTIDKDVKNDDYKEKIVAKRQALCLKRELMQNMFHKTYLLENHVSLFTFEKIKLILDTEIFCQKNYDDFHIENISLLNERIQKMRKVASLRKKENLAKDSEKSFSLFTPLYDDTKENKLEKDSVNCCEQEEYISNDFRHRKYISLK